MAIVNYSQLSELLPPLTPNEDRTFRAIKRLEKKLYPVGPSLSEIQQEARVKGRQQLVDWVDALEKKRYIRRQPGHEYRQQRSIQSIVDIPSKRSPKRKSSE